MSFFQNLFSSKLRILAFVIFPIVILILALAWVYLLFFNSTNNASQEKVMRLESNSISKQITSQINLSYSSKSITKATFEDLNIPKTFVNSKSSAIILTSPVASTPELDATEINTLLDNIESMDNNDDAALDNQILEN
jgi:hypothetical protein